MAKAKITDGASRLVALLVRDSAKAGADKRQIRIAAEALLTSSQIPIDQAWLHIVISRTLPGKRVSAIMEHLESAYELATEHNHAGPLLHAGLTLHNLYGKTGQEQNAKAIREQLGNLALDQVSDRLASLGAVVTGGVGQVLIDAGGALARLGQQVAVKPLPDGNTNNSTDRS